MTQGDSGKSVRFFKHKNGNIISQSAAFPPTAAGWTECTASGDPLPQQDAEYSRNATPAKYAACIRCSSTGLIRDPRGGEIKVECPDCCGNGYLTLPAATPADLKADCVLYDNMEMTEEERFLFNDGKPHKYKPAATPSDDRPMVPSAAGAEEPTCGLCGEPMPPGEEMFKFHGYSCECPKPPLPKKRPTWIDAAAKECASNVLVGQGEVTFAEIIERHFTTYAKDGETR